MAFTIRMGIPEMLALWEKLQACHRNGTIKKKEEELYRKWGNALKKLSVDPFYPGLQTHEIPPLSKRYGIKVWQSYLENKKAAQNGCIGCMAPASKKSRSSPWSRIPRIGKMVPMTE